MDALNALSIVTYDIDAKYGTKYNERFLKFLAYVQENDLVCDGAMTDPKGDRCLAPHKQTDPDLFCTWWRRRKDGIVVRGAKAHQTGAVNSHEIIVMPTLTHARGGRGLCGLLCRAQRYARASPISSAANPATPANSKRARIDRGNLIYGGHEALVRLRRRLRPLGEGLHVPGV